MSSVLLSNIDWVLNCTRTRENVLFVNLGLDVMGDHAVSCHGRGDMTSRHDRIRDQIISACSGALLSPIWGQKSLLPDNKSKPGYIFLPVWNAGQPAALDVAVTSPLQSSLIINASGKSGFALSAAEDRKYEQY